MAIITRIKEVLLKVELVLISLFLSTMILLSFSQIVFRKVFGSSIPDADQLVTMSVMFIALIGAAMATLEDKHITVEVLSKFVSAKVNLYMGILFNSFSVYIIYVLFDASVDYIELQSENIDFFIGEIKTTRVESFILPGFFLIGAGFVLNLFETILKLSKKGEN
jgi:TRAP-type C4-dicarboxylate transport system permease small subunit